MKAPVITVKKVHTFEGHEGIGVNADVYLDGMYVGHFFDDANGGEFDFHREIHQDNKVKDAAVKAKIKELEDYAASLHPVDINADKSVGKDPLMIQPDFLSLIDDVINAEGKKKVDEKNEKKFLKASMGGILYGVDKNRYTRWFWKGMTLVQLVAHPKGLSMLQARVNIIKLELKKGESILNADYLKSLGVTIP